MVGFKKDLELLMLWDKKHFSFSASFLVTIHTDLENASEVFPTLIASFLNCNKFHASVHYLQLSLEPKEIQLL